MRNTIITLIYVVQDYKFVGKKFCAKRILKYLVSLEVVYSLLVFKILLKYLLKMFRFYVFQISFL